MRTITTKQRHRYGEDSSRRGWLRRFAVGLAALLVLPALVIVAPPAGATSWTVETPSGTTNDLNGVSCVEAGSTTKCVAVGSGGTILRGTGTTGALTWSTETLPLPPTGFTTSNLYGVSCSDVNTCTAVGEWSNSPPPGTAPTTKSMIVRRAGSTTWADQTPSGATVRLNGVSCASSTFCVAVGDPPVVVPPAPAKPAMVLVWDGSSWTSPAYFYPSYPLAVPSYRPSDTPTLQDVDCPSATTCFAVGYGGGARGVLATSNSGVNWTAESAETDFDFFGASCVSASECVAVDNGGRVSHKAHSSGAYDWNIVGKTLGPNTPIEQLIADLLAIPQNLPNSTEILAAVSVLSTDLLTDPTDTDTILMDVSALMDVLLIFTENIRSDLNVILFDPMHANTRPQIYDAAPSQLTSVSCKSVNYCVAVGLTGIFADSATPHNIPEPAWSDGDVDSATSTLNLYGVSCTASTCWAVGQSGKIWRSS